MTPTPSSQFGRVPYGVVAGGLLSRMKGADAKVYLACCAHAGSDWRSRAGVRRLAEETGLQIGSVSRSLHRLAALGFKLDWPGPGHPATLSVHPLVNTPPFTPAQQDRSPAGAEVFTRQRKSVHPPVNKTDRTDKETSIQHINGDGQIFQFLKEKNLNKARELAELAQQAGVTVLEVTNKVLEVERRGGKAGALVMELKKWLGEKAAERAKRDRRAEAQRKIREMTEAERVALRERTMRRYPHLNGQKEVLITGTMVTFFLQSDGCGATP